MKKIALSFVSIAAVVGLAIGATSAYFTSASSTANDTFAAGTLKVDAKKGGDYNAASVNIGHLAPGEITGTKTFVVKNTGDIDAVTFSRFTLANDTGLGKALNIYDYKVEFFKANNDKISRVDHFIANGVASSGFKTTNLYEWIVGEGPRDNVTGPDGRRSWDVEALPVGAWYRVSVSFQMDKKAGNEYMGQSVDVGFKTMATQFDNTATAALGFPSSSTDFEQGWANVVKANLADYQ